MPLTAWSADAFLQYALSAGLVARPRSVESTSAMFSPKLRTSESCRGSSSTARRRPISAARASCKCMHWAWRHAPAAMSTQRPGCTRFAARAGTAPGWSTKAGPRCGAHRRVAGGRLSWRAGAKRSAAAAAASIAPPGASPGTSAASRSTKCATSRNRLLSIHPVAPATSLAEAGLSWSAYPFEDASEQ